MVEERLKYVTIRKNRKGGLRYYWQRPGFPVIRLPDDPVSRFSQAARLNAEVEATGQPVVYREGTVGWIIAQYKRGRKYKELSKKSLSIYDRWLAQYQKLWGPLSFKGAMTRQVVVKFIDKIDGQSSKNHAGAVLSILFQVAMYHGVVFQNLARNLDIGGSGKRDAVWTEEDIGAFLDSCTTPEIRLAFLLMLHTAQRPGDVLKMAWGSYNGDTITLRQEKTGLLIEVPCATELRAALDRTKRTGLLIVSRPNGRRVSYATWKNAFNEVRKKIGRDDKQARDLRRTAVVKLATAGATVPEIAAVTGHSIERTTAILEHYLPRNVDMARSAVAKLEKSNALPRKV